MRTCSGADHADCDHDCYALANEQSARLRGNSKRLSINEEHYRLEESQPEAEVRLGGAQ